MLMRKAEFSAALATKGQEGMDGVDGMTMKMSMTMADFDQPVTRQLRRPRRCPSTSS